jgi:hypothetical protein
MPPNGSPYSAKSEQSHRLILSRRAIVKAALPTEPTTIENIDRERTIYRLAGVSSAACFRQIYDVLHDNTIALEWLDTTLAEVTFQPNMRTYALIKALLKAALQSCIVLDNHGYVNTGTALAFGCSTSTH